MTLLIHLTIFNKTDYQKAAFRSSKHNKFYSAPLNILYKLAFNRFPLMAASVSEVINRFIQNALLFPNIHIRCHLSIAELGKMSERSAFDIGVLRILYFSRDERISYELINL